MTLRVLFAAGGTGGHFYPGIAVLEALRARVTIEPLFVGTAKGIESRVLPDMGYPLHRIDVRPMNRVGTVATLGALARLPLAIGSAWQAMLRFRPAVVVSVGGYAAGPVCAAAVLGRVPLVVIEPNAIPGMTHRWIGPFVTRACVTYEDTAKYFRDGSVIVTGTPVRRSFVERARVLEDTRGAGRHVLVLGGSQGARALNETVPAAIAHAKARGAVFSVTHQTGASERETVARRYAESGIEAEVVAFIDNVAAAMTRASVLVARSGAGTVAESGVIGRPAVFVPLPTAADDHQTKNAEAMQAGGAGLCLPQRELTAETLGEKLVELLRDGAKLHAMEARAGEMGRPDAADRAAEEILGIAR